MRRIRCGTLRPEAAAHASTVPSPASRQAECDDPARAVSRFADADGRILVGEELRDAVAVLRASSGASAVEDQACEREEQQLHKWLAA